MRSRLFWALNSPTKPGSGVRLPRLLRARSVLGPGLQSPDGMDTPQDPRYGVSVGHSGKRSLAFGCG